jgi:hypothetical protein
VNIEEWLAYGIAQDYCGPAVCSTHDGTPTSEEEEEQFEDGADPCVHVVRLYESADVKRAVEEFHSPSQWRGR